jgi:hypothetical protein
VNFREDAECSPDTEMDRRYFIRNFGKGYGVIPDISDLRAQVRKQGYAPFPLSRNGKVAPSVGRKRLPAHRGRVSPSA